MESGVATVDMCREQGINSAVFLQMEGQVPRF
ncbi:MAG: hypothetical protein AAF366_00210 [Pseudomonadota bacterium]